MNGKSGVVGPSGLGLRKKCQSFTDASLHLHNVSNDVNGTRMARIDGQGLPRYPFGGTIFAILFKAKGVHCEHTRISGHARLPLRQDLRDAIAEQEASAQAKVERMCGHERENIARKIDDDRAVKLGRGASKSQ